MDEAQGSTSELIIFLDDSREEHHEVRKAWYDGRFYFSVVDIIAALKVSQKPPRQYWAFLPCAGALRTSPSTPTAWRAGGPSAPPGSCPMPHRHPPLASRRGRNCGPVRLPR